MYPEIRKKTLTKTKPFSTNGRSGPRYGGVKRNRTMVKASRVRMPVRAGRGGLRAGLTAAAEVGRVAGKGWVSCSRMLAFDSGRLPPELAPRNWMRRSTDQHCI